MMHINILNGPNLNMLEIRDSLHYGNLSYDDLCEYIHLEADRLDTSVNIWQSNSEVDIINKIQDITSKFIESRSSVNSGLKSVPMGLIINAAAYSHTSIAIADALELLPDEIITIEVHLSNIYAREEFRRRSHISHAVHGVIAGLGPYSYVSAMQYIISKSPLNKQ